MKCSTLRKLAVKQSQYYEYYLGPIVEPTGFDYQGPDHSGSRHGWHSLPPVNRRFHYCNYNRLLSGQILQWRWIVERTFGWLNRSRRLSKDFEALPETTETWIRIAMIQLMVRRLAAKK